MDNNRLRELAGISTSTEQSSLLLEADQAVLSYGQVIDHIAKKMKGWTNGPEDFLYTQLTARSREIIGMIYGTNAKQVGADTQARFDELSRTHPPTSSSWAKGYDTRDD